MRDPEPERAKERWDLEEVRHNDPFGERDLSREDITMAAGEC